MMPRHLSGEEETEVNMSSSNYRSARPAASGVLRLRGGMRSGCPLPRPTDRSTSPPPSQCSLPSLSSPPSRSPSPNAHFHPYSISSVSNVCSVSSSPSSLLSILLPSLFNPAPSRLFPISFLSLFSICASFLCLCSFLPVSLFCLFFFLFIPLCLCSLSLSVL